MREFLASWLGINPTKMWGNVALFNISDSRTLLSACEKNDIAVLGIEGFRVLKNCRVPDMDCIADFSKLLLSSERYFSANSREKAKKFIDDFTSDDILLEFTLVKI